MQEIDRICDDYSQKMNKELEESALRNKNQAESFEKATRLLTAVFLPVLQEISDSLRRKGHESEVRERLNSVSGPSVSLVFCPKILNPDKVSFPSDIQFSVTGETVSVKYKINSMHGYEVNDRWNSVEVSESMVKGRVIEFVKSTLSAS